MGFLSAPSNFLAQRFHNFDSNILGLTIISMKNGRNATRPRRSPKIRHKMYLHVLNCIKMSIVLGLRAIYGHFAGAPFIQPLLASVKRTLGKAGFRGAKSGAGGQFLTRELYIYIYIYIYIYNVYIYI